jgi:N-acyl-D-amino-acid deacylase
MHALRRIILPLLLVAPAALPAQQDSLDLVIRRGRIIDGTGSPWFSGDVGIRAGRIAAVGRLDSVPARRTIDAAGLVVAPGFIDMLGQSEITMLVNPSLPSKIFQGITTEITGEGGSAGPLTDSLIAADQADYRHYGVTPDWRTLGEYFGRLERQGMGINLASYVGATQVRRVVLGDGDRQPTPAELERMAALVRDGMRDGAVGVSTALQYPPAPFARTEELIALARAAAASGGLYATHMRSEGEDIDGALDEVFRIGREANIPVEIWHLKAAGKRSWGKMPRIVARIDSARQAGIDVAADTYAYPAWFNSMSAFIPPWAHDGGTARLVERLRDPAIRRRIRREMTDSRSRWINNEWQEIPGPSSVLIGVVQNPALERYQGLTLAQVATERHKDAIETLFDLLVEDEAATDVAVFGMSEPDVTLALRQPWTSIDNDSQGTAPDGPLGKEHPHPRAYGTFPRILRKYVRQEHVLTLEDAIRKFSSLPAQRMRLADRGVLKAGMWADVVVFDPATVRDKATFAQPNQLSEGMRWVLVNGVPVIEDGRATGKLPGKVLRGPGYRRS